MGGVGLHFAWFGALVGRILAWSLFFGLLVWYAGILVFGCCLWVGAYLGIFWILGVI